MKSMFRTSLIVVIFTILTACGQKKSPSTGPSVVSPQDGGISANSAAQLAPRIVRASQRDDTTPDSNFNFSAPRIGDQIVAEADSLTFPNPVQILELESEGQSTAGKNDSQEDLKNPPFLVWDEKALSSPIVDAYYEHRMIDPALHGEGTGKRIPASFDPITRWWFIPILDLLDGKPQNAESSDNHWLLLDLDLESGARIRVKVLLRIHGSPVKIIPKPVPVKVALTTAELGTALEKQLTLLEEDYPNPTPRRLRLWINAQGILTLHSGLKSSRHLANPHSPPTNVDWDHYQSGSALSPRAVVVQTESGTREFELHPANWVSVELEPFDIAHLSWKFSYDNPRGVPHCSLPAAFPRTLGWTREFEDCHGHHGEETCHTGWEPHQQQVTEVWALAGAVVEGEWERKVRVTDRFLSQAKATLDQTRKHPVDWDLEFEREVYETPGGKQSYSLSTGEGVNFHAAAFDCAGFF